MRCKDCFIKHCRDHTNHACTEACPPDCGGAPEVLVEGVELVTTKKRKRNNPTQAIQSRCVVCKAKTCYCCSACGTEKEVALCHVSTGRNCLPIHISEHHHNSKKNTSEEHHHSVNAEPEEHHCCFKAEDHHHNSKKNTSEEHHHSVNAEPEEHHCCFKAEDHHHSVKTDIVTNEPASI